MFGDGHVVMLKVLTYMGIRNTELVYLRPRDVDLESCQLRINLGTEHEDCYVLLPSSFRVELAQYIDHQRPQRVLHLFQSNRHLPYSTRRIRQIVKQHDAAAGIEKRVSPYLFRHQLIPYLTKKGISSPKLQLLNRHATEQSLAIYRDLFLPDIAAEYEEALKSSPVR